MSTDKGYIKVYRDIRDHWIWKDKPFSKGQAWIDLIMLANHKDNTILFDGHPMQVKKGQYMTSLQMLADRWGWSRGKVRRFLDDLKTEQMADKKRHGNGTLLTLIKYGDYQDSRHTKQHTSERPADNRRTPDGHKQDIKEDTIEDIKKKEVPPPPDDDEDEGEPWPDDFWEI